MGVYDEAVKHAIKSTQDVNAAKSAWHDAVARRNAEVARLNLEVSTARHAIQLAVTAAQEAQEALRVAYQEEFSEKLDTLNADDIM